MKPQTEEQRAKRRAYFRAYGKAYRATHVDYFKQHHKLRDKAKHAAYMREYRARNPDRIRETRRRWMAKRKLKPRVSKQWELTLTNGMKQYILGWTEADAVQRWCNYAGRNRSEIANVKEYGIMPRAWRQGWTTKQPNSNGNKE